MSLLTHLTEAEVRDSKRSIEGKVYSRPALVYTDGVNVTYACDVDIGQEGEINDNGDIGIIPLRNVPIAANNKSLAYAEVGQAVTLTKNSSGHWEVTGLSKTYPGTFTLVEVTITRPCHTFPLIPGSTPEQTTVTVGTGVSIGLVVRVLGYDELFAYGTYGLIPYGAIGVFENGSLIEIRSS